MDQLDHPNGAPGPASVRRTAEIEDVTNVLVVHAIANRLVPILARLGVHPNAVSVAGMVFGIAAGLAYFHTPDARYAVLGFGLMIAWHVMDGADGQLARLTRRQSESGKLLDGLCDYVTFAAVYAGLAVRLAGRDGEMVWLVVIAAGVCHALQSASYEAQRQEYEFWGYGRPRNLPSGQTRAGGSLHRLYAHVQSIAIVEHDNETLAAVLRSRPECAPSIRRSYRETFAAPVRRWSILSANYRTIGIFICALPDVPLLYFAFDIVGFSLILAILTIRQRRRFTRFVEASAYRWTARKR